MKNQPKNLVPRYVSVGFGHDSEACMLLSNAAAKIINGSPAEETPRERPLVGRESIAGALTSRDDLGALPVVVRDGAAVDALTELGITGTIRPVLLIEDLERAALEIRTPPPPVFELGAERRSTARCVDSLDEARTIAGRTFYALNGLSERDRLDAVKRARESSDQPPG